MQDSRYPLDVQIDSTHFFRYSIIRSTAVCHLCTCRRVAIYGLLSVSKIKFIHNK